jgi:hypothetical protein
VVVAPGFGVAVFVITFFAPFKTSSVGGGGEIHDRLNSPCLMALRLMVKTVTVLTVTPAASANFFATVEGLWGWPWLSLWLVSAPRIKTAVQRLVLVKPS